LNATREGNTAAMTFKTTTTGNVRVFEQDPDRCLTACAGLVFSVEVVGCILACNCGRMLQPCAPVYLVAVLEYLVAEVVELGGNIKFRELPSKAVSPAGHITTSIFRLPD